MRKYISINPSVAYAIKHNYPVVALESTVITHGLPSPENFRLAQDMEKTIRDLGVLPATIAILDGKIRVGLSADELKQLTSPDLPKRKVGLKDISGCLLKGSAGGTTVAASLAIADLVGIKVFATGGIGGVHRGSTLDVSNDLLQLSKTPLIVVCSGAKSLLDLPATVEYLETMGVPLVGFQTDQFPAFYSRDTTLPVDVNLDHPKDIAALAKIHWELGLKSTILVGNPAPSETAIESAKVEKWIQKAQRAADEQNIKGGSLTPFIIDQLRVLSKGQTVKTNLSLLLNNAYLAANIAKRLFPAPPMA